MAGTAISRDAVATASGTHLAGEQSHERKARPFTEAEGTKQLRFRVFKRRIECVYT
jgi:hypothetical protein